MIALLKEAIPPASSLDDGGVYRLVGDPTTDGIVVKGGCVVEGSRFPKFPFNRGTLSEGTVS